MHNAILFQAYGGLDFINECKYALLKYLQVYNLNPPGHTGIYIYTDQPHHFSDFLPFFKELVFIELTAEKSREWRGPQNFVHRLKIEMIADFMQKFEGNVLYCDTDTYLLSPIEDIFSAIESGDFYMHAYEGVMDKDVSPSFHKWEAFLSSTPVSYNDKQLLFHKNIQLFNAGVIGMSSRNKEMLTDVLALSDSIYQKFQKHIAEQFAFNYVLQQNHQIKTADSAIGHYWNLKEFRLLLRTFFANNVEESIPNLVKKVHHIDALDIQAQKTSFKNLPFLQRFIKRISGSAWRIGQYEKKL